MHVSNHLDVLAFLTRGWIPNKPSDRRPEGPLCRPGSMEKRKISCSCRESKTSLPARSLIVIPTELLWLTLNGLLLQAMISFKNVPLYASLFLLNRDYIALYSPEKNSKLLYHLLEMFVFVFQVTRGI
jgi:hypothetical protein